MAGLLGIGKSAMDAAYVQLQTVGNNIANVHTEGYVRQEAQQTARSGSLSAWGFNGGGVDIVSITRRYDQFLAQEVTSSASLAGGDSARAEALDGLDRLLADTENGIGSAVDALRSAIGDVVNQPADPSARQAVLRNADTLAERVRLTDVAFNDANREVNQRITDSVSKVNEKLESIARLNDRIVAASGQGRLSPDLLDQRDRMIDDVAKSLQVQTLAQPNGSLSVFTATGQTLVLGASASKLVAMPDQVQPSNLQVAIRSNGATTPLSAGNLGSGELAGVIRFRDENLAAARGRVGQLAVGIAGAYNAQQALGLTSTGQAGPAMFSVAPVQSLAAPGNTGNVQLAVSVATPSAVKASDYRLRFDGTAYQVERIADGTTTSYASLPATHEGLTIGVASGSMAAGDLVTIQSASSFAAGFRRVLPSGDSLATAFAASAQFGATNRGDLSLSSFAQVTASPNAAAPVAITFTSPTTYDVSGTGTGNPTGLTYTPGQPIAYNGWSLALQGTPAAGDTLSLGPVARPANDNRNARAMAALGDQPVVDGMTFNDAFATLLSDVGNRTVQAQVAQQTSEKTLSAAKAAFSAESGVNLDEEAAKLLQYQQAYQAAARVISTAQTIFDSILSVVGR